VDEDAFTFAVRGIRGSNNKMELMHSSKKHDQHNGTYAFFQEARPTQWNVRILPRSTTNTKWNLRILPRSTTNTKWNLRILPRSTTNTKWNVRILPRSTTSFRGPATNECQALNLHYATHALATYTHAHIYNKRNTHAHTQPT